MYEIRHAIKGFTIATVYSGEVAADILAKLLDTWYPAVLVEIPEE